jgi:hypothetical protein
MPIVSAVGVAVQDHTGNAGNERVRETEAAMSQAILDANAKGITDPIEIRKLMLEARDKVRAKY